MQTTMTLEACCRCGQPIAPGEPAMQTASVDIIGGRAVSSPVKAYHLKGRCYDDVQGRRSRPQGGPESRIDGSHRAALTRPANCAGLARSSNRLGTFPGTRRSETSPPGAWCVSVPGVVLRPTTEKEDDTT